MASGNGFEIHLPRPRYYSWSWSSEDSIVTTSFKSRRKARLAPCWVKVHASQDLAAARDSWTDGNIAVHFRVNKRACIVSLSSWIRHWPCRRCIGRDNRASKPSWRLARICNIYPDAFKPCLLFPKPTSSWSESLSLASFKAWHLVACSTRAWPGLFCQRELDFGWLLWPEAKRRDFASRPSNPEVWSRLQPEPGGCGFARESSFVDFWLAFQLEPPRCGFTRGSSKFDVASRI